MKIIDILQEANHTTHIMTRLYQLLRETGKNLSGNNSGMVALAISKFYKDKIKSGNMKIALIYKSEFSTTSVCDLVGNNKPSYLAVANKFGEMFYMADYRNSRHSTGGSMDGLITELETKANVGQLDIISDLNSDTSCLEGVINQQKPDTGWGYFYESLVRKY